MYPKLEPTWSRQLARPCQFRLSLNPHPNGKHIHPLPSKVRSGLEVNQSEKSKYPSKTSTLRSKTKSPSPRSGKTKKVKSTLTDAPQTSKRPPDLNESDFNSKSFPDLEMMQELGHAAYQLVAHYEAGIADGKSREEGDMRLWEVIASYLSDQLGGRGLPSAKYSSQQLQKTFQKLQDYIDALLEDPRLDPEDRTSLKAVKETPWANFLAYLQTSSPYQDSAVGTAGGKAPAASSAPARGRRRKSPKNDHPQEGGDQAPPGKRSPRTPRGSPKQSKKKAELVRFQDFAMRTVGFLKYLMALKVNERKGWLYRGMTQCESIADHSYRMGIMAMLVDPQVYDVNKALKLCIVHDMAECIVGDITPHCGVPKEEKLRLEQEGMDLLLDTLGKDTQTAKEILALWTEYEDRETKEAQLVKDFDRIDLILQAITYQENFPRVDYQEFFDSAKNTWFTEIGQKWSQFIDKMRSLQLQQHIAKGGVYRSVVQNPELYSQFSEERAEGCIYNTSQVITLLFLVGNLKRQKRYNIQCMGFNMQNVESDASHMYSMFTVAFLLDGAKINKDKVMQAIMLRNLRNVFEFDDFGNQEVVQKQIDMFFGPSKGKNQDDQQLSEKFSETQTPKRRGRQRSSEKSELDYAQVIDDIDNFERLLWAQLFIRKNEQPLELILEDMLRSDPKVKRIIDLFAFKPSE